MQGSTSRRTTLPADIKRRLDNFASAQYRPDTPLLVTLRRLRQFASSIQSGELLPVKPARTTITDLVRDLADSFCSSPGGTPGMEFELLKKSVQEALLMSVDVQDDATVVQFQRLLQKFLKRQGTVGLLKLFVGIHMYNVVWFELTESDLFLKRSEENLAELMSVLERACLAKADGVVRQLALD